ncbi:hypothetical protein JCM8097_001700 [Rhodosporidiobolus ruineniae]
MRLPTLLLAVCWAALALAAPIRLTTRAADRLCQQLEVDGRRLDDLAQEICDTLTQPNSTYNILSSNEIVGVEYEGAGLLDGLDLDIEPSILSGIFQTATPTPTTVTLTMSATATAPHRSTFPERKSALSASASSASAAAASAANKPLIDVVVEGQGLLDGIDITIAPSFLNSLLRPKPTAQ